MPKKAEDPKWRDRAHCRGGGQVWFSTKVEDHLPLYSVCSGCPVYNECLRSAIREGTHQVFRAGRWWQ